MSYVSSDDVEQAVIDGFQKGIEFSLGLIPAVGPFVQVIFGQIWDLAFIDRTIAQKKAAMDSLFESVSKMIRKALASNIADQAKAYNASISQLGQDYRISVQAFKENENNAAAVQKVVVRFESCKSTLIHMLNLYSQPTYIHHTVMSYGSALSLYVSLLREMMLAGKVCGYSKREIQDFQEDVNQRLKEAYEKTLYEGVRKLVEESGEFMYPNFGGLIMDLGKLVGGLMNFQTEWHDGKACLIAKSHPDYADCDVVDNKAYYQLQFRTKIGGPKNYYSMPQVFMNNRPALHVYRDVDKELELSSFTVEETMDIKIRAYYLVDYSDYDSSDVEVSVTERNTKVIQFHLNKRERAVLSLPWVRMYYSNIQGGPWSTHYDRFSKNMRMHYDEYAGFIAEKGKIYTILTKAGSSSTKNYYIIGFEVVPTAGVPNLIEGLFEAFEKTTSAVVSGVGNIASGGIGAIGKLGKGLLG